MPDTINYLFFGLTVVLAILGAYAGLLVLRLQNAAEDLRTLDQLN